MLSDNNIKDIFNNPSLDNEDWLKTPDAIFDRISDELFEEKKERAAIWFWFGGGIILLTVLALGYYLGSVHNKNSLSLKSQEKKTALQVINLPSDQNTTEIDPKTTINLTASDVDKKVSEVKETTTGLPVPNQLLSQENNGVQNAQENNQASPTTKNTGSINKSVLSPAVLQKPFTETIHKSQLESAGLFKNSNSAKEEFSTQLGPRLESTQEFLSPIKKIPLLSFSLLTEHFKFKQMQPESFMEDSKAASKAHYFSIFTGRNNWDFRLNDNYSAALNPADFRQTNGKGYLFGLGYYKQVKKKLRLNFEIQYENVELESGHNSQFIYELGNEDMDRQNATDLTMATPLGFVSSPVLVNRLDSNTSGDNFELALDLSNRHILKNLDLGTSLNYQLLSFKSIDFNLLAGGGWNRILSIKNELYQVKTDNNDFNAVGSELVTQPDNINPNRSYYTLGSSLSRNLTVDNFIALSYQFRRDVTSIYKQDDFNTQLTRHNLNLSLLRKF